MNKSEKKNGLKLKKIEKIEKKLNKIEKKLNKIEKKIE